MAGKARAEGGITVFLALVTVLIASLLLAVVESARTQATQTYLVLAANSAVDSLFSQYHRELWEEYRILGLEMYSQEEITEEFEGFLEPYFDENKVRNFYRLSLPENSTALQDYTLLTDNSAAVFEEEILDYMRYGIAASVAGVTEMEVAVSGLKEADGASEVIESMEEHAGKAAALEKRMAELKEAVETAEKKREKLGKAVSAYSYSGYCLASAGLKSSLNTVIRKAEAVSSAASELRTQLDQTAAEAAARKTAGKISEETFTLLTQELSEFKAYVSEQGDRLREAESLKTAAQGNLVQLAEADTAAAEAVAELSSLISSDNVWISSQGTVYTIKGPTASDYADAWSDTAALFDGLEILRFSYTAGSGDSSLNKQLDTLQSLLNGGLLQLVCPYAAQLSSEKKDLTESPSRIFSPGTSKTDGEALLRRVFVDEYVMTMFSSLLGEEDGAFSGSGSKALAGGSAVSGSTGSTGSSGGAAAGAPAKLCAAETEYILYGKESERENIAALAGEFMALRTGLNLISILKDPIKRKEALAVAAKLGGAALGAALTAVIAFLVMSVWAAAQAALDVRDLLAGQKVPLVHTDKSFYLTAERLITDFPGVLSGSHTSDTGLDYRSWLRILLYLHMGPEAEYRMMDVIQWKLREKQPDFLISRIYTGTDLEVRAQSGNLFTVIFGTANSGEYELSTFTHYSY